jgi:hypothetical protein
MDWSVCHGALSSILGYDAIHVEDKHYMIVLNRSKMTVNSNNLQMYLEEQYKK